MNPFLQDEHCEAPEIPGLLPVLEGWIKAHRTYAEAWPLDPGWGYRERSCIGFLAAGAWLSGGVALEEWGTERINDGHRSPGRCDLWVARSDQYDFQIEAKQTWSDATGDIESQLAELESKLGHAARDASTLDCEPKNQLGVLFVAPSYPPNGHEGIAEHIATWLEGVYSIRHSAIAWFFQDRQGLRPSEGHISPGIVMIARTNG